MVAQVELSRCGNSNSPTTFRSRPRAVLSTDLPEGCVNTASRLVPSMQCVVNMGEITYSMLDYGLECN